MSNSERFNYSTRGLYMVIRELMSAVWVECGDVLPSVSINENDKAITVGRKADSGCTWVLDFRVEDRVFSIEYNLSLMYASTEGIGDVALHNATEDDLAIAGALVLKYYVHVMSEGEKSAL